MSPTDTTGKPVAPSSGKGEVPCGCPTDSKPTASPAEETDNWFEPLWKLAVIPREGDFVLLFNRDRFGLPWESTGGRYLRLARAQAEALLDSADRMIEDANDHLESQFPWPTQRQSDDRYTATELKKDALEEANFIAISSAGYPKDFCISFGITDGSRREIILFVGLNTLRSLAFQLREMWAIDRRLGFH